MVVNRGTAALFIPTSQYACDIAYSGMTWELNPSSLIPGNTRSASKRLTTKLVTSFIDIASYSADETHHSCLRPVWNAWTPAIFENWWHISVPDGYFRFYQALCCIRDGPAWLGACWCDLYKERGMRKSECGLRNLSASTLAKNVQCKETRLSLHGRCGQDWTLSRPCPQTVAMASLELIMMVISILQTIAKLFTYHRT